MTSSFTEIQAEAGKPPYPRKEGVAPWLSMNLRTAVSISRVVTPGRTILPAKARAAAVICPARRIPSISLGDFNEIILKAPVLSESQLSSQPQWADSLRFSAGFALRRNPSEARSPCDRPSVCHRTTSGLSSARASSLPPHASHTPSTLGGRFFTWKGAPQEAQTDGRHTLHNLLIGNFQGDHGVKGDAHLFQGLGLGNGAGAPRPG